MVALTPSQHKAVETGGDVVLVGRAGSGKTTALQHRLLHLLRSGVSAYNILVLISEYGQEEPFLLLLHAADLGPYADLQITTYNSLAREMVSLFWPLVARDAGFAQPHLPPTFLEYDMAQLLMWRIYEPMAAGGAFAGLRLRPQRIVSQLIDILNRAAFNGLSLSEAIARQAGAWQQDLDRLRLLDEAAEAVRRFRETCLARGLLDFSLTIEVFDRQLVGSETFRRYFTERYRHVLVDNIEEATHAAQHFVASLRDQAESLTVVYDRGGGYRRFLSADPAGAQERIGRIRRHIDFDVEESFTSRPALRRLGAHVAAFLSVRAGSETEPATNAILDVVTGRYRRQMLANLPARLAALMRERGIEPADVAILAPYLDGALQYTLRDELKRAGIPYRLLRRRSSPREEPRVRAWLTWLALAHPDWGIHPRPYDVSEALELSVGAVDPARAALLADHLYDEAIPVLNPVEALAPAVAERVGEAGLRLVSRLQTWLAAHGAEPGIDRFLFQLFNDLLGKPAYQPAGAPDMAGGAICDWLVRTAGRIQQNAPAIGLVTEAEIGRAFVEGINQGLVTANPPDLGEPPDEDGVVIAPVYSYLLSGAPARLQVWLECGIMGWWQTPYQPLSNAFVLVNSREGGPWTAQDDIEARNQLLASVIQGLTSRCRDGVVVTVSDLDRRGQRQLGPLWRALQPIVSPGPESA